MSVVDEITTTAATTTAVNGTPIAAAVVVDDLKDDEPPTTTSSAEEKKMSDGDEEEEDVKAETTAVDGSILDETQTSLYSERSKKRRYRRRKDKKPGATGRTWTKVEDPHAPRKPRSGYVHFLSSRRARYGTVKQGCDQKTINVALAAEWQALSDEERRPFLELATKEREQYQIELKAYEKTEHYRDFLEKKERILRLRKQRRRMGAADSQDDDFDESLDLNETTFVEGTKKRVKNGIRRNKRKASGSDEVVVPMVPNSKIPIFSQEFLEYNKKREAKLRAIRHEIGVAEAEKAAMQRTIEKMQAKNLAYEAQAAHDRKIAKEADHIIECWMRVLRGAMGETMKEYNLTTPEETVAFLTRLADGDAPNEDVLQSVKDVIRSASFLLPK